MSEPPEVEREYVRCGNCGFMHFSHLVTPDNSSVFGTLGNKCPAGIGMQSSGMLFRPASDDDLARWAPKIQKERRSRVRRLVEALLAQRERAA